MGEIEKLKFVELLWLNLDEIPLKSLADEVWKILLTYDTYTA